MLKKCPKCGNVTDSTFCGDCGTDLSDISAKTLQHSAANAGDSDYS